MWLYLRFDSFCLPWGGLGLVISRISQQLLCYPSKPTREDSKRNVESKESKLYIRPDKYVILYEHRSGNRWYKAKGDRPPEIMINGEKIEVLSRREPYNYLGKPFTLAGEHTNQVPDMLSRYKEILENIASCSLPLALKIEAIGMMGISKIEHHFSNTYMTERQLQNFDKGLVSCLRRIFNLNINTTIRTFFIMKQQGGIGVRKPSIIYRATRINFLAKMINHSGKNFRYIARNALHLDFNKRGIPRTEVESNFLGYAIIENGLLDTHIKGGCGVQSDWPQLFTLVEKMNAELKWERCSEDLNDAGRAQLILRSATGSKIVTHKSIRKELIKEQLNKELCDIKELPMQGRLIDSEKADYLSPQNNFRNHKITDELMQF